MFSRSRFSRQIKCGALFVLIILTSCAHAQIFIPGYLNGRDVEKTIDAGLAPSVRSSFTNTEPVSSRCPDLVDVSGSRVAHCTLIAGGVPLPIHVRFNGYPNKFKVGFDGTLYSKSVDEKFIEVNLLQNYGITANAHCNEPKFSERQYGENLRCSITGSHKITFVEVVQGPGQRGPVLIAPPNLTLAPYQRVALRRHREGLRVVLSGAQLARIVNNFVAGERRGEGAVDVGRARCAPFNDLSKKRHAECLVPIGEANVRYNVQIVESLGFQVSILDAVLRTQPLVRYAENILNQRLVENGEEGDAVVHCGKTKTIVRPAPGTFSCVLKIGDKIGTLHIAVEDANGAVHIGSVEMKR